MKSYRVIKTYLVTYEVDVEAENEEHALAVASEYAGDLSLEVDRDLYASEVEEV